MSLLACSPHPSSEDVPVTDFLDERRKQINDRLRELEPVVEEYAVPGGRHGRPGRHSGVGERSGRRQRHAPPVAGADPAARAGRSNVWAKRARPPRRSKARAKKPGRPKGRVGPLDYGACARSSAG
jgi:hypothetical protein